MSMPELVPENYVEINQYFADFEPSERINKIGFGVMHALCPNEMHYIDGSDDTVQAHLEDGGSIILAPYHQSNLDTPTTASIACEAPFELLRGRTIIPAKAEIFKWPGLGRFFPHMGAHPTFRKRDFDQDEAGEALRKKVGDAMVQYDVDYINNGGNIAIFPQGERHKQPHNSDVPKPRTGIARIARGVNDPSRLLIVTAAYAYRGSALRPDPVVVINRPFSPAGMTTAAVLEETHAGIQESKDIAFRIAA